MRIAITNPTNWPYLRRGLERFINELAEYLSRRGHEVDIVCGAPGKTEVVKQRGYTTWYYRRLWHPALQKAGFLEFHAFFFPALFHLLRHRYDVVFTGTFMDAYAAKLARRVTGTPYVLTGFAIPPRVRYFRSLTLKGAIYKRAVLGADAFLTISNYVRDYFIARWDKESPVLRIPVDTRLFRPVRRDLDAPPTILCAAALDDPRKGGRVLMRAFDRLKNKRPDLRLQLAWSLPPRLEAEFADLVSPCWHKDVHFLGTGVDLPEAFARASITVLPSLWEAQGMVLIESLAAGTPVVCTRDGALPEIVTDPRVGCLFDPGDGDVCEPTNVDGLVHAIEQCLELSRRPETSDNCRTFAQRFSWDQLGPAWESMLEKYARKAANAPAAVECRG